MPHFTAPDGARLFYRDEGVGRPLLCLPGLTRTGADFDYLAPHLPPLRLIRPDYRGRGGSDWTGPASYTVPQEAADVVALLDHLGLDRVAVIGTSRGGIIGMFMAATARDRLAGLCLNDVGPELAPEGLEAIRGYVGAPPTVRTHAQAAEVMARRMTGFANVPPERWLAEARRHFRQTDQGLELRYDPALREAFAAALDAPVDMWPLFDACAGLPLALIRGAGSDLLTRETMAEMQRRRPDMIVEEVPDRAHIPFLDEPESLRAIHRFLELCP